MDNEGSMYFFKSPFNRLNKLICSIFGCVMHRVTAMAFPQDEIEPIEILLVCPRCKQAHCHLWPHISGDDMVDDMLNGVEFMPDFDVKNKTLN